MVIRDIIKLIEKNQNSQLEEMLSEMNAKNLVDDYGDPILIKALHVKNIEAAKLLAKYVDVNLKDAKGQTALHHCGYYRNYAVAVEVLKYKGNLDIEDAFGNQPLWTAVFNVKKNLRGLDVVQLYLDNGANKNHKNKSDRSPLDFALQVKFAPLLEVLQKD